MTEERLPMRAAACCRSIRRGRAKAPLSHSTVVIWLIWLLLFESSGAQSQPHEQQQRQHGTLPALKAFLARPLSLKAPPRADTLPEHLARQQTEMLQALHRHKVQDAMTALRPATSSSAGSSGGSSSAKELRTRWPLGYVAVCAVVKDQPRELRYWIEYHRWLGIDKFYLFDNNSSRPLLLGLWDLVQAGVVDYQYFVGRPRSRPDFRDTNQYRAYQACLLQHVREHRWLAFLDVDEFLVFPPSGADGGGGNGSGGNGGLLPALTHTGGALAGTLLRHHQRGGAAAAVPLGPSNSAGQLGPYLTAFESHAALGVNWVLFGSDGRATRPRRGPLASYASCVPRNHWESTHVKIIANTGGVLGLGGTPHEVLPRPGRSVVDVDGNPFNGPKTPSAKWHGLVLHHYVIKSREEFAAKNARGSGAGNVKSWAFFDYMDGLANASCPWGMDVGAAFMASQPPLRPPRGGSLRAALCGSSGDGEAASVVTNSSRISSSSGGGGGAMGPHASSAAAATLDRNQPALVAAYEEESG